MANAIVNAVKKIKADQAQKDKAFALFQAGISVAVAIINALKTPPAPNLGAAALAAAIGGLQIAAIAARPIPQFKKGTLSVDGVNTGGDSIHAMLQPGEAVIPRSINQQYAPAIEAIYKQRIPASVLNAMVTGKQRNVRASINPYDMRYAMDGVGIKVRNTDQLATAIAERITGGYNRTRNKLNLD